MDSLRGNWASTFDGKNVSGVNSTMVTEDIAADKSEVDPDKTPVTLFTAVELETLKTFLENYSVKRELTREDCIALDYTFGPVFLQCLEMIDEENVVIRRTQTTRDVIVEVYGKRETYYIPPGHSMCQCLAFKHGKKEYCKHILAAHIFLGITPEKQYKPISDQEFKSIVKDYFS